MERRFDARLQEMLAQAEVSSEFVQDLLARLNVFVAPFVASVREPEQRQHAAESMTGLLSNLERKTSEAIAYLLDQDRQRLQQFLGQVPWDHQPLLATLALQVGQQLGEPDGVLVFDPSGFSKKGGEVRRCRAAVVRSSRKSRELSGLCVSGLCLSKRTCACQLSFVSSQGMDTGPSPLRRGGGAPDGPVPHAP